MLATRLRLALAAGAVILALPVAAFAKPTVAVLGIEVVDASGAVDTKTTAAAKTLSQELREEASRDDGKFELAKDSAKDLLELKLLYSCSDEGRRCMADIGKELKADFLLFGKIEKRKNGYHVAIKLLDTATAQMATTHSDIIPFTDATPRGVSTWARSFYARLTGAPEDGALVVRANADSGSVYIDGDLKTNLAGGAAKVTGLSRGSHQLAIEADGFERHEEVVEISAGSQTELVVQLLSLGQAPADESGVRPGGAWRAAFAVSLGATAIGAVAWTVEAYRYSGLWVTTGPLKKDHLEAVDELNAQLPPMEQLTPNVDACDQARQYEASEIADRAAAARKVGSRCERGQFHANMTIALGVATSVTALASAFFYYKGYVAARAAPVAERGARRTTPRRGPAIVFTPTISPTALGAGLAIEF